MFEVQIMCAIMFSVCILTYTNVVELVKVKGGYYIMNKSLILKVLKVLLLVLIGVSFFLPFVTGKVFSTQLSAFVTFSDNLFNVDDFAIRLGKTADSTMVYVYIYMALAVVASVILFVKEAYGRVANLVTAGLGLVIHSYVYYSVFIDKSDDLKAALKVVHPQLGHTLTMNVGYGLFVGLVLVVVAFVFELYGKKLLKSE